jgi:hypothetical protein
VFSRVSPAGFVAAENGRPVALLELMPRDYARRNGYITGSTGRDEETLTIVCLEVALNQDRRKVMDGMVAHLTENLELFRSYKRIEVGRSHRMSTSTQPGFMRNTASRRSKTGV